MGLDLKENGLKVNSLCAWVEACKFGQMDLDMKDTGKKAKLGGREG